MRSSILWHLQEKLLKGPAITPGIVGGAGNGLLLEALKVPVVLARHVTQLRDVGICHAHAIGHQLLLHILLQMDWEAS
jgi:hypothetical protein